MLYHGGPGGDQDELRETQTAAKTLGVQIQALHVLEPDQLQRAYAAMTKERAQALIIFLGSFTGFHQTAILDLAAKIRIPTMCGPPEWSEAGGLISYGHDRRDQFRRAAVYVDKILKGTKPADLPVQQPTKFEIVINLKTAKQIGVTIPPNVLTRAVESLNDFRFWILDFAIVGIRTALRIAASMDLFVSQIENLKSKIQN